MVSVGYDKLIYKSNEYKAIEEIIIRCTYENPKNRSSIFDIINYFTLNFIGKFQLEKLYSKYEEHFHNLDKIILIIQKYKNKKDPLFIFNFGVIYFEGKYVTQDIEKAIQYYLKAADKNCPYVFRRKICFSRYQKSNLLLYVPNVLQYNLGLIYSEREHLARDISKVIHYYTLAVNQNNPQAQLNLGIIYIEGKYVLLDIKKAIFYFQLSADQNILQAQNNLGFIYLAGKYINLIIGKKIRDFYRINKIL